MFNPSFDDVYDLGTWVRDSINQHAERDSISSLTKHISDGDYGMVVVTIRFMPASEVEKALNGYSVDSEDDDG